MISYTPFITWILVCSYENISMVTVSDVRGIKGALYLKSIHLCTCLVLYRWKDYTNLRSEILWTSAECQRWKHVANRTPFPFVCAGGD